MFNFRGSRQPTDIRQLKDLIALWRTAFPDLHFQVIDVIEEGKIDTTITLDFAVQQLEKGIGVTKAAKGVTTKTGGIDLSSVELVNRCHFSTANSLCQKKKARSTG